MNPDALKAAVFLETFFPLLEEFVSSKTGLKMLSGGMKSVQIEVERERLARQVAVVRGELKTGAGIVENPSLVLRFQSLEQLGALLGGKTAAFPALKRRTPDVFTAALIAAASALMGATLHPSVPLFARSDRKLRAKLLLHAASYAMESVARLDPQIRSVIRDVNGEIVQIGVLPAGPFIHLALNPGAVAAHRGAHPAPHARVLFENLDAFHDLVAGKADPVNAYLARRIFIEGESVLALMAAFILQRAASVLSQRAQNALPAPRPVAERAPSAPPS
ncbi:MAG: SCP2 sterol-binding domain-containing protein [bacterium]